MCHGSADLVKPQCGSFSWGKLKQTGRHYDNDEALKHLEGLLYALWGLVGKGQLALFPSPVMQISDQHDGHVCLQ